MLNAQLSNHGHQSAVADYVIQSYSALAGFQRRVSDLFLSRALDLSHHRASRLYPQSGSNS